MNLLLDTHALLWALHTPERLSQEARAAIGDGSRLVYFSAASVWELAIKSSRGKLDIDADFLRAAELSRFSELPVRSEHAWAVRDLPPFHGDPFDRILISQAMVEKLTIVTRDHLFSEYGVPVTEA
jgi:PIN domain nuclease of toxin-antitoxin system